MLGLNYLFKVVKWKRGCEFLPEILGVGIPGVRTLFCSEKVLPKFFTK